MDRIREAYIQMRRNRRAINREKGIERIGLADAFVPTHDPAVYEGVNATPEEIIVYQDSLHSRERHKVGMLYAYAISGLATEMTMHETNSLLGGLSAMAESMSEKYPGEATIKRIVGDIARLDENFSFLSRFKVSGSRNYQSTPAKALNTVKKEFGRAIGWGDLVIEATDAFMKADIRNDERILYASLLNLVRNSYQWGSQAKVKPVVVRFDSETIEHEIEIWDDETETSSMGRGSTDIIVVEDNGPGLPPGTGDEIFQPGVSGRNSSGIGLHLCRAGLESHGLTIVADGAPSELGGARFRIGRERLLRPAASKLPSEPRPREVTLAEAITSMRVLVEEGNNAEAVDLADLYEEAAGVALRIRLRGAETADEESLLEAVDAFEVAVRSARSIQEVVSGPKP